MTSSLFLVVQQPVRRIRPIGIPGQLLSINGAASARPGPASGGPSVRDRNMTGRIGARQKPRRARRSARTMCQPIATYLLLDCYPITTRTQPGHGITRIWPPIGVAFQYPSAEPTHDVPPTVTNCI